VYIECLNKEDIKREEKRVRYCLFNFKERGKVQSMRENQGESSFAVNLLLINHQIALCICHLMVADLLRNELCCHIDS